MATSMFLGKEVCRVAEKREGREIFLCLSTEGWRKPGICRVVLLEVYITYGNSSYIATVSNLRRPQLSCRRKIGSRQAPAHFDHGQITTNKMPCSQFEKQILSSEMWIHWCLCCKATKDLYTRSRCCSGNTTRRVRGDPSCWMDGYSFEDE